MKKQHRRNRSTEVPSSSCTACGKACDVATALSDPDAKPMPGDTSVCLSCGHIMTFDDRMALRDLTSDEMYDVAGDPLIVRFQKIRTLAPPSVLANPQPPKKKRQMQTAPITKIKR